MIPAQGRQALITTGWIGLPGGQLVRDRTSSLRETLHSSAASTVTNDAGDLAVGPASRHQLGDPLLGTGQRLRRRSAAPRRTDLRRGLHHARRHAEPAGLRERRRRQP